MNTDPAQASNPSVGEQAPSPVPASPAVAERTRQPAPTIKGNPAPEARPAEPPMPASTAKAATQDALRAQPQPATDPAQLPTEPARDPFWHRPIFVLAPARSYSSVVASMIGMHPELYGFPELAIFRADDVAGLITNPPGYRGLPLQARIAGLVRAIAELHEGKQDEAAIERATNWLCERKHWQGPSILDHLLREIAPLVAIEKSPEDSNREDYLERIENAYPRARYLHLTRHPVATVKSMHAAWSTSNFWDIAPELFHLYLLGTWLFHHGRVVRFSERLPPDRWMRMRSEDVLNDPRAHLPLICRWLGIDHGEAAVEAMLHPEKSPYARLGPDNARGGNDPAFLRSPVPQPVECPPDLELPEEWIVDPWLYVAVTRLAAYFGYGKRLAPLSPSGTAPRLSTPPPQGAGPP